jgi:eukaryotic-like serine/threonine-protein kinase
MTASPPAESRTPESSTPLSETSPRRVPLRAMSAQQFLDERDFSPRNAAIGGQFEHSGHASPEAQRPGVLGLALVSDKDRWKEISEIIEAALRRPADERPAFLTTACAGDEPLRLEIESLLSCHSDAEALMASPAIDVMAAAIVADSDSLIGRQLGPYRVDARIGSGGMGDVYRATDVRLRRPVALKILPRHLADDPYLRERFVEEAQAVAAVHHPHICVLHDVGQDGETEFLVMEHLEGETLAVRLTRGPLSPTDVFRYATEIADALVATHESGITHRDLKPGNIMLTNSGTKLLDFGLATLHHAMLATDVGSVASHPPMTATPLAGTLQYMAPEQLQRQEVDHRTDIFAFGALLYEMVTGRKAFDAESRADLVAAILTTDPAPIPASVAAATRALEPLIRRCLAKDPNQRWQNTRDMANEIGRLASGVFGTGAARPVQRRRAAYAVLAVATVTALAAVAVWRVDFADAPLRVGNTRLLTAEGQIEVDPAISPDGRFVAYTAGATDAMRIFVRPVAGGPATPLSNGIVRQYQPRWSPDGRHILFITLEGAFVAPAFGGATRRLDSELSGGRVMGAAWSPDGRQIAIASGASLTIVPFNGGTHHRLPARSSDELHHCDWSPNRVWIACVSGNPPVSGGAKIKETSGWARRLGNIAPSAIVLIPTMGGPSIEIADRTAQNLSPAWSPDSNRLYFVSNRQGIGDIYSIDVSDDGNVRGEAARLTTGLGAQSIAFSTDRRRLAYAAYSARANLWSMPIPSRGPVDISRATPLTSGNQVVEMMRVSPDGKWVLYDSTFYGNADIFRIPTGGGPAERLTTHPSHEFAPAVSPDGLLLAYHSWRTGTRDIFVQPLDGGPVEQVTGTPSQESYPVWLADSRSLIFFDQAVSNGKLRGFFVVHRDEPGTWGTPRHLDFDGSTGLPSVLPDGNFVYNRAGSDNRAGGVEIGTKDHDNRRVVYQPAPQSADPMVDYVQVAPEGGHMLYLKSYDTEGRASIWSLPVSGGAPALLVRFDDASRPSSRFEFAVGGGRFFFAVNDRRSNIWLADVTEQ